jgi:hypothetical protein
MSMAMPLGRVRAVAVASLTWVLVGCGAVDGVELNGKIFDWMGVSPTAQEANRREPRLADRAPLVLPPDSAPLPEPGSGQPSAVAVDDVDQRRQRDARERERLHLAYCRGEINWQERVLDKSNDSPPRSPYGPCPSLISGATN